MVALIRMTPGSEGRSGGNAPLPDAFLDAACRGKLLRMEADPVRCIHALDPKTGQVVARWLPTPPNQASHDGGRFLRLGKKLFLVTDEEFAEVNTADIVAKKNGWE